MHYCHIAPVETSNSTLSGYTRQRGGHLSAAAADASTVQARVERKGGSSNTCTDGTTNTTTWCVMPANDDDGAAAHTPWILDLSKAAAAAPLQYLHPISVHVEAGDIFHLPSLWFHAVTQTCETVGINWWFDMYFDSPLYCYFQLLESCKLVQRAAAIEKEDE